MSLMLVDGDVLNSLLFMNLAPNEPVYARACLALVSRMVVPFEARLHAMCIAISGIRDMAMKSKLNTQDTVKSIVSSSLCKDFLLFEHALIGLARSLFIATLWLYKQLCPKIPLGINSV